MVSALETAGASTELAIADRFAVHVVRGELKMARRVATAHPGVVRTFNEEEDRLLADVAGRPDSAPTLLLIELGADLAAPGLDEGTPLHQAAWFGQPANARALIAAGAPTDIRDATHGGTPLEWAVHGATMSGDAESRLDAYVAVVDALLRGGAAPPRPDFATPPPAIARRLDAGAG